MTVVHPNHIVGINSITVQTGDSLSVHKADGSLIRTIVSNTGVSTFHAIEVSKGGGDLNVGVSTFFVDNSTGRIGIGTVSPNKILTVRGSSTPEILLKPIDASPAIFVGDTIRTSEGQHLAEYRGNWDGTTVGRMVIVAGDDTGNKDNGEITFNTAAAGSTIERLRIASDGKLLVGHTAAYGSSKSQIFNTSQYLLDLSAWSADANGPTIDFYKSRNATIGNATVVQSGDVVGKLRFLGNDGANSRTAAQITAEVDGTPGTNDMPGRLVFSTVADDSTSVTERLRINSSGHVVPGADSTYDLGLTGTRFRNVYADTVYGDGSNLTGVSAGVQTALQTATNAVVTLDLSKQDHKLTLAGICTVDCKGGTEGDAHTVRIINSGIATVGFSTYFLFPSGASPVLPSTNTAINQISFTVHHVGAGATQLLAGASLNYG